MAVVKDHESGKLKVNALSPYTTATISKQAPTTERGGIGTTQNHSEIKRTKNSGANTKPVWNQ